MNTSMGLAKKFTSGVVIQFTLTDVIIFRSFKRTKVNPTKKGLKFSTLFGQLRDFFSSKPQYFSLILKSKLLFSVVVAAVVVVVVE